jgi:hypothetical protein
MAKRYTKKDNQVILMYVSKYPSNLQFAFEKAAIKLNRDNLAVCQHYYKSLRNSIDSHLTCGSKRGFTKNVKNSNRRVAGGTPNQELSKIKLIAWAWRLVWN